jgi:RecA-family ATPase
MLLQGTLVCLAGDSNVGKSVMGYALGISIACGLDRLGTLPIDPSGEGRRVLYFDEENSKPDREKYLRRVWNGILTQRNGKEPDIGKLEENFWLKSNLLGVPNWAEVAEEWILDLQPHIIIFDTAVSCFDFDDENANAEAVRALKELRRLMALTSPTALCVVFRHAKVGKDAGGRRTMRGAKVWRNLSDGVIFHVKGSGRPRKGGLHLSRFIKDKTRAYGMDNPVYITPSWTDDDKTGLVLDCSRMPTREHRKAEQIDKD